MSREIIRAVHGMISRRVINAIKKEVPAYMGVATHIVTKGGVGAIVIANTQDDLVRLAKELNITSFDLKKTSIVAVVHHTSVTLTDTGFEPQLPVQPTDYDRDDEL